MEVVYVVAAKQSGRVKAMLPMLSTLPQKLYEVVYMVAAKLFRAKLFMLIWHQRLYDEVVYVVAAE
eukprot:9768500-Alexandrium_andersonii.AAC.1